MIHSCILWTESPILQLSMIRCPVDVLSSALTVHDSVSQDNAGLSRDYNYILINLCLETDDGLKFSFIIPSILTKFKKF
jgi:hypothetical protein